MYKLIIILSLALGSSGLLAQDLMDVYRLALQHDAELKIAESVYQAELESLPVATSALKPQIGFSAQGSTRELDLSTGDNTIDSTGYSLNLVQSLYNGVTLATVDAAEANIAKARAEFEVARQELMLRVAERYFTILAAQDNLDFAVAEENAIARQLDQATKRFEVGLIAITDVQESQAAHDQAVADEIAAKRTLATAREFLREITGQYVESLAAPGDEFPMQTPNPASANGWVDLALSQNLALVSSRLDEQLARDEISFRKNGHYPTIDLVVTTSSFDSVAERNNNDQGFLDANSDFKTDTIGIQFNLPIFAGGATSSRVREAVYLHTASREQLQRVTRETERQTRDAYLGVLSEKSRVEALQQAVQSSRTALDATQAGFEVGTRTIVDVLDSQFALYRSITLFYQARYDYLMNVLRLKQAAGNLQIQDLEDIDRWLTDRPTPEQTIAEEENS